MADYDSALDWTKEVIAFLKRSIPWNSDGEPGWDHMFSSSYQLACNALTALGQADKTNWGAKPRHHAGLPKKLPRRDDICVAVLSLIDQTNGISYRLSDGSAPSAPRGNVWLVRQKTERPSPPANIAAACGLHPAWAKPDVMSLLRALGLVKEGGWTEFSETVFWRVQPTEWDIDFTSDARFCDATERTVATVPSNIRLKIDELVSITEADVVVAVSRYNEYVNTCRTNQPNARIVSKYATPESARKSLVSARKNALDWLFFRGWRLDDGWLTPTQAERALEIFHDSVAIAMRRAVVARLHPALPLMAEW